ncbi:MAG: hypothetical protein ISS93_01480 [Candidatus Aenigmarchaeota archaeon]|nr:hypothetical protein [Candidatus Aenigmarchaeota archaeon]
MKKTKAAGKKGKVKPPKAKLESPLTLPAPEKGRKILVVGIEEADVRALSEMVLKGNRRYFPRLTFARLPDLSGLDTKKLESKKEAFSPEFSKLLKKGGNIIMAGSLTAKGPLGFAPILTEEQRFADLAILLELDTRQHVAVPGYGIVRKGVDTHHMRRQQELNRYHAFRLAGTINILPLEKENVKKSLRELKELLMAALKD